MKEKRSREKTPAKFPLIMWIIVVIIIIALLAVAVLLGLSAEHRYGTKVFQALPKTITSTWGSSIIAPKPVPTENMIAKAAITPTIFQEPTPPPDTDASGSEFILSFSNTRKVVSADLIGLTPWELKVARNEIYARHGRPFVHRDLSCYFAKQPWYTIDPSYTDKSLSSMETTNAVFILSFEKESNSPLVDKDSGCK